jgi:hypothetical protein
MRPATFWLNNLHLNGVLINSGEFVDSLAGGRKKREAPGGITSASRATQININRTSLDHLLLGMVADIDKLSIAPIIKPLPQISKLRFLIRGMRLTNRNLDVGVQERVI